MRLVRQPVVARTTVQRVVTKRACQRVRPAEPLQKACADRTVSERSCGSATGSSRVWVRNTDGLGAQTTGNGILLVEAIATLVAGVCGGVAQTTPYIGQPAYKHMGARSGYTLLTGLFIGIGGMLGLVSGLVQWLPLAVLAPIIVYVALDIATQAFHATPPKHTTAMVLGFLPSVAYMLSIKVGNPAWIAPDKFAALYNGTDGHGLPDLATIVTLGNGFIITAMIWTTALVAMIDGRNGRAVVALLVGAVLTLFGIIHSVHPQGGIYLPWVLEGLPRQISWQFVGAYVALAALLAALSLQREPIPGAAP